MDISFITMFIKYALCLSSCPKAPEYIFLMAANCPAVCSCLVAGCVDAYLILVKSQKNSTSVQLRTAISLCCNSIRNIASLSKRVALEVSRTLTSTRSLMVGVQIEILLEINPNAAASMVSKLFSSPQDRFNIENESNRLEIGKNCRHRRKVYDNTFYHLMEQESYKPDVVDVIENESTLIIKKLSNHLTDMISERLVSNIGNEMIILRAIILTLGATPMKNKFDVADNIEMLLKAIDEVIIRDDGTEYNSKYLHYILAFASASFPHLREDCDGKRLCRKIVINILANRDPCDTFVINVTVAIIAKDFSSYCVLMRNLLTNQSKVSTWNIFDESAFGSFLNNILLSDVESELKIICQKSILDKVLLVDPLAFLGAADAGDVNEMELYVLIQTSLKSDDSCEKFCSNEGTVDLLEKTISYTLRKKLPFLSPVDVLVLNENFCRNSLMNNEYLSEFAKLCIYVYYFLRLYEIDRSFPFGVDIFSLSLDKIFNHCQSYRFSEDKFHFYRILCDTIIRVHPSLSSMRKIRKLQLDLVLQQVEGANITIKQVIETTKIAVERNGDESYSYKARVLYFSAKENEDISSSLLDLGVSCALLSSSTSTSPCYTYANLCEDPLVVLKCHLNIWKSNNLCLILLEVFEAILQINEDQLNLKIQSGRDAITAEQYLVSRDTIVVRTLLFLICEPSIEEAGSVYEAKSCRNAILKVLRKIFSQRKGLVFSLIKQDISEEFLNVIVHSVPEAVQDSDLFVSMLQDQSAPIVSRLKVADASFRIVALNINNKVYDEELAQKVVFAGMTVMINSFYIAQGAVGIAAEILRVDDSKVDVCRLCRDTILRMVRHMEKISSHREALKHECSIALAKVSELCKQNEGDRNSLFIRSMSEATTRAINVLGGRVHA